VAKSAAPPRLRVFEAPSIDRIQGPLGRLMAARMITNEVPGDALN
jgi:hypothetical protein